jgi:hypothetical protein
MLSSTNPMTHVVIDFSMGKNYLSWGSMGIFPQSSMRDHGEMWIQIVNICDSFGNTK